MKTARLSTKLLFVSGLTLVIFGIASFGVLYRGQSQLVVEEMDSLLENQEQALSVLVSGSSSGKFDFEVSPFLMAHFKSPRSPGFFRFIDLKRGQILRESAGAPALECQSSAKVNFSQMLPDLHVYRLKNYVFQPRPDEELKESTHGELPSLCLLIGVDEGPYRSMVLYSLFSTLPLLIALVLLLMGILTILIRGLTSDLSGLTSALERTDFGATHEFPLLPEARTQEVKAVVEKLASLHSQAAELYREMWLFIGRAAHQLKTPVTAIQATLQVLLRKERSKDELIAGLTDVQGAVDHLSLLTKQLISSSRLSYQTHLEKETVDLETLFAELLKLYYSQAEERGVAIQLEASPSLKVNSNSILLSELFGNLIENSILYSPRNQNAKIRISWCRSDQGVEVTVADQGPGFAPQVKKELFKPFVRGDERLTVGSGLGLSIARKIAQILNGDIALVESSPQGSRIMVTLPLII